MPGKHAPARHAEEREINDVIKDWMKDIRSGFAGAVIRRTIHSKDWEGNRISGLPPYVEAPLLLTLTEEEHEVLNSLAEAVSLERGLSGKNLQVSNIPTVRKEDGVIIAVGVRTRVIEEHH